jgi:hypothetical protein
MALFAKGSADQLYARAVDPLKRTVTLRLPQTCTARTERLVENRPKRHQSSRTAPSPPHPGMRAPPFGSGYNQGLTRSAYPGRRASSGHLCGLMSFARFSSRGGRSALFALGGPSCFCPVEKFVRPRLLVNHTGFHSMGGSAESLASLLLAIRRTKPKKREPN